MSAEYDLLFALQAIHLRFITLVTALEAAAACRGMGIGQELLRRKALSEGEVAAVRAVTDAALARAGGNLGLALAGCDAGARMQLRQASAVPTARTAKPGEPPPSPAWPPPTAIRAATNTSWAVCDFAHGLPAQGCLMTAYAGLAAWGFLVWGRRPADA